MIYDIKLTIAYDYAGLASSGRHLVCVMPRDLGEDQRLVVGLLELHPEPDARYDRTDFFGNALVEFAVSTPHKGIEVTVKARVERTASGTIPAGSIPLRDLPDTLARYRDLGPESPLHFTAPSVRVPLVPAITQFAQDQLTDGMTVADAVLAVGHALHAHMKFDAQATTVDTPASEAFEKRHGVCQDFSHIMIAGLRGIGVPAGYVSGFLRTQPPPGKPRLEGADAMHAWVRAWCGQDAGWIAFDPTNNRTADTSHIVVAHGRDYADVAPIRGVLRGSGGQQSRQLVDVIPLETAP